MLLLLASLPSEYKEFNRAQTKGMLPPFHEIKSRLLDEKLTLKLEGEKDEVSEALYLKQGQSSNRNSGKPASRPAQSSMEQSTKPPRRDSKPNQSGSAQSKVN